MLRKQAKANARSTDSNIRQSQNVVRVNSRERNPKYTMAARAECFVSSELTTYLACDNDDQILIDSNNVISKFPFQKSTDIPFLDEDGDLVVSRKDDKSSAIFIEHSKCTSLYLVGHQVWRGALLLADWVLHNAKMLENATVIELGSGTGLTSIAAATVAREVISTDANLGKILPLIEANARRNAQIIKNSIKVMELDFFADQWTSELADVLSRTSVIIAADVIYDDDLTEAFVTTLKRLLSTPPAKTLYMALEKRCVFTLADFDSVAPCFEHFLRCISKPDFPWKLESVCCDFPQYFNYEKTKELVLWKIESHL